MDPIRVLLSCFCKIFREQLSRVHPGCPPALSRQPHQWLLMVKYSAKSPASQKINQYLKHFCLMSGSAKRQWTWILFLRRLKKYFLDKVFAGSIGLMAQLWVENRLRWWQPRKSRSSRSFGPPLYQNLSLLGKDRAAKPAITYKGLSHAREPRQSCLPPSYYKIDLCWPGETRAMHKMRLGK